MTGMPMMRDKPRILIVADWNGFGEFFSAFLVDNDFKVTVLETRFDIAKILSELSRRTYAVVVLLNNCLHSQQLPDAVSEVKKNYPKTKCVVHSGQHDSDLVIELERRGIDDFLPMPIELSYFLSRIKKAARVFSEDAEAGQNYGPINIQGRFSKSGKGSPQTRQGYVPGQTKPGQVFTHTNGKKYRVDPNNPGDPNDPYVIPVDEE